MPIPVKTGPWPARRQNGRPDTCVQIQEQGTPGDICIDLYTALISAPSVSHSLTVDADDRALNSWPQEGEQAILLAERGLLLTMAQAMCTAAFFDRIQLIQRDILVRFRHSQHRRLSAMAAGEAPSLTNMDGLTRDRSGPTGSGLKQFLAPLRRYG